MELFLSVFLGIIAGAIIGGISLLVLDIFNKYFKRKDVISSLIYEIDANINITDLLESQYDDFKKDFNDLTDYLNVDYYKCSNVFFNQYIKDIPLILNRKLIVGILYTFDFADNISTSSRDEMFKLCKKDINALEKRKKDYNNFLDKYKKRIEEKEKARIKYDDFLTKYKNSIENIDNDKISTNIKKQLELHKKLIENYISLEKDMDKEKILHEKMLKQCVKIINIRIDFVKKLSKHYQKQARKIKGELENELNLRFFTYLKLLFRYYFKKTKI